jgi:hypothetical protein
MRDEIMISEAMVGRFHGQKGFIDQRKGSESSVFTIVKA